MLISMSFSIFFNCCREFVLSSGGLCSAGSVYAIEEQCG